MPAASRYEKNPPVLSRPDPDPGLPGLPWWIRPAAGPAGRPAVEIYAAGRIVDVLVAPALAVRVLRGACSVTQAGQRWALAWGYLPPGAGLSVVFSRGLALGRAGPARISMIAGWFWVAPAEGRFRSVTVHHDTVDRGGVDRGGVDHGGGRERCRVRAVRACWPQHRG